MIITTIGKFSNEFDTISKFNKEYKSLKEDFSKQIGIERLTKVTDIILLWGDLFNNNKFIKITSKKYEMLEYIKKYKDGNFKLELLDVTLKINK